MIYAFIFASLILMAAASGTVFFQVVTGLPVLGPVVQWWGNFVGPVGDGLSANLVHGMSTAQVVVLALAVVLNGPASIRAIAWALRACRSTTPPAP